ncbi:hypothetical protein CH330_02660 [candidate division WOR-3 bacterium JGI_Cruoil_03_51_56]|uniref:Uncharacterized protein n=1 Tax=candidate division WOR-3 bacterium JGI_Cruoil_03_51_56 TaxID=1973747 RepID=A0A235BWG1_UNCW3|nr:MAG: hypothetical protein CH330_02660 [candidate division WOR-3 bacterium JGI_Cruoil_03_51_56]
MVRLRVIERTLSGLTARAAAEMLRLSTRQVFRLKARVRALGAKGVVHGNCGRRPANAKPAFRPVPAGLDLRAVLCAKTFRKVTNDNTINYKGHAYQLKPNTRSVCVAGTKVMVQEWFDGSVHVRHERAGAIPLIRLPDKPKPQRRTAKDPYDTFAVLSV